MVDEVDELASAYTALKRIPPDGRDPAMRYLSDRLEWEHGREKKAALAVARFVRKLARIEAFGHDTVEWRDREATKAG